jgi:molecular chaperone GrpE
MADKSKDNEDMDEPLDSKEATPGEGTAKDMEIAELKEQLMRASADFDNFRKRSVREKEELQKFALENLMLELLEVYDNFERALEAAKSSKDIDSVVEGVEMVFKQFVSILEKKGLRKIESHGMQFDPHHHEAMMHVETCEHPDNTVVQVHRSGYELSSKVIRPAMVTVAKNPEDKDQD